MARQDTNNPGISLLESAEVSWNLCEAGTKWVNSEKDVLVMTDILEKPLPNERQACKIGNWGKLGQSR